MSDTLKAVDGGGASAASDPARNPADAERPTPATLASKESVRKPTPAQRRALAVLARYAPLGASTMEVACGLWGAPSAANEGKAYALLCRMRLAGWVIGDRDPKCWSRTAAGFAVSQEGRR